MKSEYPIIDAHAHMAADDAAAGALLSGLNVRVLNISLGLDAHGAWRTPSDFGALRFAELAKLRPDRFAWCTSFDLPRFDDDSYAERVIADLERDFAAGAVACKVWKNFGMEVRDRDGRFVLIDHPMLSPVFEHLERRRCPVILHVGEPKACWEPLDEASPHYAYYSEHPEWHMHGRVDVPNWATLLAARDRLLARHTRLRVVGAHLASIEHDVDELAQRLDRFPNLAVDTGGRLLDLALQEPRRVQEFFERYANRILFGSDICLPRAHSEMTEDERQRSLALIRETYELELRFYASSREVVIGQRRLRGIAVSETTQRRFFCDNAAAWLNLKPHA